MKLLVSHLSALRYWRAATELEVAASRRRPCRIRLARGCVCSAKEVRRINPQASGLIMSVECPLDILVPKRSDRRDTDSLRSHVCSAQLPHGAFRRIDDAILVSSPEFVYLQLASVLDEVELARIGNELCGSYSIRYGDGFDERVPLTTKRRLTDFVNRAEGMRGARRAKRCLRWIADGSASPRETMVLLAMCLPKRLGGYALPLPQLNKEIEVGDRLFAYVEGNTYRPDYYWVRRRNGKRVEVTAEYDSAQEHNFGTKAERTRIRRNDFKAMGYLVTSINKSQLESADAFERAVRQIARDLGLWRARSSISELADHDALLVRLQRDEIR